VHEIKGFCQEGPGGVYARSTNQASKAVLHKNSDSVDFAELLSVAIASATVMKCAQISLDR